MVAGVTKAVPDGQPAPARQPEPPESEQARARLLGEFAITAGGATAGPWPRPSARRLCELLLVSTGHRVTRDLACEELFPGREPRAAARALSKALSMARAALGALGAPGAALLGADLTHLWFNAALTVDAEVQAGALRAALALPPGQERDQALTAALAPDDELLPDEPYASWAERARDRHNALRQQARLTLARDRSAGAGRHGSADVMAAWLSCLDHDPASEEAAAALIRGYLAQGQPEQVVRVYESCRAALEELGLRISPSLERIYASVAARVPQPQPAPAGPVQAARQPREERRPVTVLFAEVDAPTGLAGAVGLEGLRDLVGGALAIVIAQVEGLGGTVTSVSGRGLQAIFGAPEAHEDDPERAVRAAYRAVSATPVPAEANGHAVPGPGLRIGIESGPAVVGPIGDGAKVGYTAFGDVVSIAAALQAAARPGAVLVGPATQAATAHLFRWGTAERVALTAGGPRLPAAYLEAPLATLADRRPRLGGRAPLTGRQAELRALEGALRAATAGRGQAVLLTGEPGIGKSRLVQEGRKRFIAWVGAGSGRRPLWLEGRGVSYASATPYGLYRQLIASWIGVPLDQPPALLGAALTEALTRLLGNTNLLAPLAALMGLPQLEAAAQQRLAPEEMQRQVFAAVRTLAARFAAVAPTVLVLEDLHWADPTSLRLTAELAALARERALLLIATTRPGPHVLPAAREIRLRPLPAEAAAALATSLLGKSAGPKVLTAALASTDGNPLFLEERLAELLDAGALVDDQGTWRLRQPASPPLPQVLERLVRARVDRLSPPAADAVRAAAVLGIEFSAGLLAAVLGSTPVALGPVLAELTGSDLVRRKDGTRSMFVFRHALIQEATHLALLRAERRDLHARAARSLEAAATGRVPEVAAIIGRHYAMAEDAERAGYYLELAGDHATDAFANDEAVASFREALAVSERGAGAPAADLVRLHAKVANVLWRTARQDEARAAFQAALALADGGPRPLDPALRAHLYTRLGRLELLGLDYGAATRAFDAAEAILGPDGARYPEEWLELMVDGRADLYVMRFENDRARAVLERARPILEAHGTPARKAAFYRIWTMQQLVRNRLRATEEDIAALRAALAAAEQAGEEKDIGYATYFVGWALWLGGDLAGATPELTRALALAERIGEKHLRSFALLTLALTALRGHDTERVRALLPRALAVARSTADGSRTAGSLAVAAWLAWQDGRTDEVLRLAAEIDQDELSTISSTAKYRWVYLFPVLAVRLRAGETEAAAAAARRVIEPGQMLLADDLERVLTAAVEAGDRGDSVVAARELAHALELARDRGYF